MNANPPSASHSTGAWSMGLRSGAGQPEAPAFDRERALFRAVFCMLASAGCRRDAEAQELQGDSWLTSMRRYRQGDAVLVVELSTKAPGDHVLLRISTQPGMEVQAGDPVALSTERTRLFAMRASKYVAEGLGGGRPGQTSAELDWDALSAFFNTHVVQQSRMQFDLARARAAFDKPEALDGLECVQKGVWESTMLRGAVLVAAVALVAVGGMLIVRVSRSSR